MLGLFRVEPPSMNASPPDPGEAPDAIFTGSYLPPLGLWQALGLGARWLRMLVVHFPWRDLSLGGQAARKASAQRARRVHEQAWVRMGDRLAATGAKLEAAMQQYMQENTGPRND
jgi:hypothetical protein